MNNLRLKIFVLISLIGTLAISAAEAGLRLQTPRQVIEGRKFTITLRLSNAEANPPQAPKLRGCKFVYGPSVSTMSSTQIINGQMSSSTSIDYTFTYLAEKAGEVSVPAISINAAGKKLTSNSAKFTILPPDKNAGSADNVAVDDISTHTPRKISSDDMFVRISLSKSSVYEQEALIATVKVYTKYNISSFRATTQPTFEGFLSEELDVPGTPEQEHYNGQNYTTAVLKRCILYPQKTGKLTVTSGKFEVTIVQYEVVSNGFFQTRRPVEQQVVTQSNNASVNVRPLPEPRPASFNGAVGAFEASVNLSPLELSTNEASTLTYTISGTGNIKYLKAPSLNVPAGIDQFTPKTDINASYSGANTTGTYKVLYTLVPQEPGTFDIPSMEFSYFNPQTSEYKTIPLQGFKMKVAQGANTSVVSEQNVINKGITDILHIKASDPSAQVTYPHFIYHSALYWTAFVAMAIILVVIILAYRRNVKLNADVRGRKLARAGRVAAKRLKAARQAMNSHNSEKFYQEINSALWGYMSDKLGIPASQLVRDNIAERLTEFGVSADATSSIISVLDECEMARFTPMGSDTEMSAVYDRTAAAINSIEEIKK